MHRRTLAVLVALEIVLIAVTLLWKRLDGLDLDVYRLGAQAFFEHQDPYAPLPATRNGTFLPFTYPPFAALAFAPLLAVPLDVSLIALTVISVIGLGAVIGLGFAHYDRRLAVAGAATLATQAVALISEPVRATLGYGQINILLMVLVAVDCLAPMKRWPRGVLLGVAAAVKLTPLVFVLFFLARKDFRSIGRVAVTFAGCGLIAGILAPGASKVYWTKLVFSGVGIGDPAFIGNQALRGTLARIGWSGVAQTAWAVAVVAILVVTWVLARRAVKAGQPVLAVFACAFGGLLVSPLSWTHHWIWTGPAIGVLCWHALHAERARATGYFAVAALAAYVFIVSPVWDTRPSWPLQESYVLFGVLFMGVLALLAKPFDDVLDGLGERGDVVRVDRREHADP